jgi:GxxExxY protein
MDTELIYKDESFLADEHRAQIINYLKATGYKLGLLVNFGHYPRLEYERLANTSNPKNDDHVITL